MVSLGVLKEAHELGYRNFWLQPGAENKTVVDFGKSLTDSNFIHSGPCVLVELK